MSTLLQALASRHQVGLGQLAAELNQPTQQVQASLEPLLQAGLLKKVEGLIPQLTDYYVTAKGLSEARRAGPESDLLHSVASQRRVGLGELAGKLNRAAHALQSELEPLLERGVLKKSEGPIPELSEYYVTAKGLAETRKRHLPLV